MQPKPAQSSSEIHYRFISQGDRVTLELWEPLPAEADSLNTYRFRLRYDLSSRQAADRTLEMYLLANPCTQARRRPSGLIPHRWENLPALPYT